ncbi:hypothetical protein GOBAR_DD18189 [Gossypium barbadense]|nr:hypothetical protein GOBAR_DD18189 [Gossypium barbadense]
MGYIGSHGVQALKRYKYSGVDHSYLAKYLLVDYDIDRELNLEEWGLKLVVLFSRPNMITLTGFMFLVTSTVLGYEKDLKVIREAEIREEMLDREASLRRARAEASLSDGISWGMGEDAIEEVEVVENYKDFAFLDYAIVGRALDLDEVGDKEEPFAEMEDVSISLKGYPDIEGVVEDSISSSWKSQGLALLQVECYLMLHSMVVYLSQNLNLVLLKQGFVATLCTSFFNHDC